MNGGGVGISPKGERRWDQSEGGEDGTGGRDQFEGEGSISGEGSSIGGDSSDGGRWGSWQFRE